MKFKSLQSQDGEWVAVFEEPRIVILEAKARKWWNSTTSNADWSELCKAMLAFREVDTPPEQDVKSQDVS